MDTVEEDIAVKGKTKRILAFDLMRGFFLLVIMVDHIELYPNGLDVFTGKGRLWVSAAEGFFFMSGLLIGMIYRRRLALGMKYIFTKMWKRAAELYIAGVGLTLFYLSWVEFSHHSPIKDTLPNPLPWHHFIEQAFLMRFTYGWADFLVRFAILMLVAPFVFYVIAKGKWWLALIGIVGVWIYRGQSFTLAWQLIFNLGILIGYYWNRIEAGYSSLKPSIQRRIKLGYVSAAAATFIISYSSVFILSLLFHLWGYGILPHSLQHVAYDWGNYNHDIWLYADKWTMGPIRVLLFFVWFPVLFWLVRKFEVQISRYSRGVLVLLGQNSLLVYIIHSFIVFIFKMYVIPAHTTVLQNFLITTSGLIILVFLTKLYKSLELSFIQNRAAQKSMLAGEHKANS